MTSEYHFYVIYMSDVKFLMLLRRYTHTHTLLQMYYNFLLGVYSYFSCCWVWRLSPTFYCRGSLWTWREPSLVILVQRLHSHKQFDYSRAQGCLYAPWLHFIILLSFLCFGKRSGMWHCGHVAVRGQLVGVGPLLQPCGSQDWPQQVRLGSRCLYTLRHLTGPFPWNLKLSVYPSNAKAFPTKYQDIIGQQGNIFSWDPRSSWSTHKNFWVFC